MMSHLFKQIKNMNNNILLWLDDYRNPFLDIESKVPKLNMIINWVLNYEEFIQWIKQHGLPKVISFDHDLADEHYTPQEYWSDYEKSKAYQDAQNYKEKTGLDCAKWLVEYCMNTGEKLPLFFVHSANPVGSANINSYLNNYTKSLTINK